MLVYTTNILYLPIILAIWIIDFHVVVSGIRLIASQIDADWARRGCAKLAPFTDPVHRAVSRFLGAKSPKLLPSWLTWLVLLFVAVLLRQALFWIIVR